MNVERIIMGLRSLEEKHKSDVMFIGEPTISDVCRNAAGRMGELTKCK